MAKYCADCRWISIPDGQGGGDGERVPCEDHVRYLSLDEFLELIRQQSETVPF